MLVLILALAIDTHAQGVAAYKAHQYQAAISNLQEASRNEKPDTAAYKESMLLIGQSYFNLSQAPNSIPFLEKVRGLPEADYMLGFAYWQNKQPQQAANAFADLFHVAPGSAAAHLVTGQMLIKKGLEPDAEPELQRALQMDGKLPQVHFLLGEIALYQGRTAEGIAQMKAELELNPDFAMAWYRLGDGYSRLENYADAIPQLQRSIWLNPDFSGPFLLLGKCYLKLRNYDNAESMLKAGLKLDPNNRSGLYLLAQTFIAEGKREEGEAALKKFNELRNAQ